MTQQGKRKELCTIGLSNGYTPSSCISMLVLSRFFARATSCSVTLVQIRILAKEKTYFPKLHLICKVGSFL